MRIMCFSCLLTQHPLYIHGWKSDFHFKSYYIRITYQKTIAAIWIVVYAIVVLSDASGQSKLKTFWKGFTIQLDGIRDISNACKRSRYRTQEEFGKVDSSPHGWLLGVQDFSGSNWRWWNSERTRPRILKMWPNYYNLMIETLWNKTVGISMDEQKADLKLLWWNMRKPLNGK